jgi:hypothetical protein
MAAASVFTQTPIARRCHGLAIHYPKLHYGGIIAEPVKRDTIQFNQWISWFYYTVTGTSPQERSNQRTEVHSLLQPLFPPMLHDPFCVADEERRTHP